MFYRVVPCGVMACCMFVLCLCVSCGVGWLCLFCRFVWLCGVTVRIVLQCVRVLRFVLSFVVWCDVVWCGVFRCGVLCCGVRCGVAGCDFVGCVGLRCGDAMCSVGCCCPRSFVVLRCGLLQRVGAWCGGLCCVVLSFMFCLVCRGAVWWNMVNCGVLCCSDAWDLFGGALWCVVVWCWFAWCGAVWCNVGFVCCVVFDALFCVWCVVV